MISRIDTDRIDEIARDLMNAADLLESEFNSMFKRLSHVPTVTKEWTGTQATAYFSSTDLDRPQYTAFVAALRNLGRELAAESTTARNYIKANNTEN